MLEKPIIHVMAHMARKKELHVFEEGLDEKASAVLCFHDVSNTGEGVFSITPQYFLYILDNLNRPVCSLDELVRGKKQSFSITVDDGYKSVYQTIYPILKERGFPFVTYIITDKIGSDGYMTEDEIKELSLDSDICTIGSHMCSHRKTREMSDGEIRREWRESKMILESITGKPVVHAALPYGSVVACSKKSIKLGLQMGYLTIATTLAIPYKNGSVVPRFVYQNNKPYLPALIAKA